MRISSGSIITLLVVAANASVALGQQKPPLPLPPPVRFEEACLQSGGAAGAITPSITGGNKIYEMLESDRAVLFTFNLAEGTRAVTIRWMTPSGVIKERIVAGATTFTVSAKAFTMVADENGPAAWCTRVTPLD